MPFTLAATRRSRNAHCGATPIDGSTLPPGPASLDQFKLSGLGKLPGANQGAREHGRQGWRRDIEQLRGLAIALVILFHAGAPTSSGYLGVDIFFAISGFVITNSLRRRDYGRQTSVRQFAIRRMRRLLPGLMLVLIVTAITALFLSSPFGGQQDVARMSIAGSTFAGNVAAYFLPSGYFVASASPHPLLHLWSLGVEEQFYLATAAVLLIRKTRLWRTARWISQEPTRALFVVLILSAGLFVGLSTARIGLGLSSPGSFAFYSPVTRAWEIIAGVLVALLPKRGRARPARMAGLGLSLVVVATLLPLPQSLPTTCRPFIAIGGTVLILASPTTGIPGPLGLSFSKLGWMSYEAYLWHWPVLTYAAIALGVSWDDRVLACVVALAMAAATARVVRDPRLHFRPVHAAAGYAAATASSIVLMLGANASWWQPAVAAQSASETLSVRTRCLEFQSVPKSDLTRCLRRTTGSSGRTLVLAGDSHAASLASAAWDIARHEQANLEMLTVAACPFIAPPPSFRPFVNNCREAQEWVWRRIFSHPNSTAVIVTQYSAGYLGSDPSPANAELWSSELTRFFAKAAAARIPVVYVLDVPQLASTTTPCEGGPLLPISCGVSRSTVMQRQAATWRLERRAAEPFSNVVVVDPSTVLCSRAQCHALIGHRLLYLDGAHLNDMGARELEPLIERALKAALAVTRSQQGPAVVSAGAK